MILDIVKIGASLIDKIIPDPVEREKAKAALLAAEQNHELEQIKVQLSAIIAEAQSEDPWTSRARPSFLWVIYILILSAIPMGILFSVAPESANAVTDGFKNWLHALPQEIVTLFGVGYLGYTGARTIDKRGRRNGSR